MRISVLWPSVLLCALSTASAVAVDQPSDFLACIYDTTHFVEAQMATQKPEMHLSSTGNSFYYYDGQNQIFSIPLKKACSSQYKIGYENFSDTWLSFDLPASQGKGPQTIFIDLKKTHAPAMYLQYDSKVVQEENSIAFLTSHPVQDSGSFKTCPPQAVLGDPKYGIAQNSNMSGFPKELSVERIHSAKDTEWADDSRKVLEDEANAGIRALPDRCNRDISRLVSAGDIAVAKEIKDQCMRILDHCRGLHGRFEDFSEKPDGSQNPSIFANSYRAIANIPDPQPAGSGNAPSSAVPAGSTTK